MFQVKDFFTHEIEFESESSGECIAWCGRFAYEYNCGIMGEYNHENKHYCDCGPKTFYIEEV